MRQIGKAMSGVLDPLTAKRASVDVSLALAWQEIVGEKLANRTQPLKIQWPQRLNPDDPFKPGVLIVAAEGSIALDLQYQSSQLIDRINRFFGYPAINRIKIEQKPIVRFRERTKVSAPELTSDESAKLEASMANIADDGLRDSLRRLGTNVLAEKQRKRSAH